MSLWRIVDTPFPQIVFKTADVTPVAPVADNAENSSDQARALHKWLADVDHWLNSGRAASLDEAKAMLAEKGCPDPTAIINAYQTTEGTRDMERTPLPGAQQQPAPPPEGTPPVMPTPPDQMSAVGQPQEDPQADPNIPLPNPDEDFYKQPRAAAYDPDEYAGPPEHREPQPAWGAGAMDLDEYLKLNQDAQAEADAERAAEGAQDHTHLAPGAHAQMLDQQSGYPTSIREEEWNDDPRYEHPPAHLDYDEPRHSAYGGDQGHQGFEDGSEEPVGHPGWDQEIDDVEHQLKQNGWYQEPLSDNSDQHHYVPVEKGYHDRQVWKHPDLSPDVGGYGEGIQHGYYEDPHEALEYNEWMNDRGPHPAMPTRHEPTPYNHGRDSKVAAEMAVVRVYNGNEPKPWEQSMPMQEATRYVQDAKARGLDAEIVPAPSPGGMTPVAAGQQSKTADFPDDELEKGESDHEAKGNYPEDSKKNAPDHSAEGHHLPDKVNEIYNAVMRENPDYGKEKAMSIAWERSGEHKEKDSKVTVGMNGTFNGVTGKVIARHSNVWGQDLARFSTEDGQVYDVPFDQVQPAEATAQPSEADELEAFLGDIDQPGGTVASINARIENLKQVVTITSNLVRVGAVSLADQIRLDKMNLDCKLELGTLSKMKKQAQEDNGQAYLQTLPQYELGAGVAGNQAYLDGADGIIDNAYDNMQSEVAGLNQDTYLPEQADLLTSELPTEVLGDQPAVQQIAASRISGYAATVKNGKEVREKFAALVETSRRERLAALKVQHAATAKTAAASVVEGPDDQMFM